MVGSGSGKLIVSGPILICNTAKYMAIFYFIVYNYVGSRGYSQLCEAVEGGCGAGGSTRCQNPPQQVTNCSCIKIIVIFLQCFRSVFNDLLDPDP